MTDLSKFKQYLSLADQLGYIASKDDLMECARLLAINLAHYELTFGSLPMDATHAVAYADEPNDAQIEMLTKGMESLVGVLGGIVQGLDEKTNH